MFVKARALPHSRLRSDCHTNLKYTLRAQMILIKLFFSNIDLND